jgi:preprotein translocase subunit SecD
MGPVRVLLPVPVRVLRAAAPLALVAGLLAACGGGSSSGGSSAGDSTILGASSGFEIRPVYARYAPGVALGPQLPKGLQQQLSSQSCPMKAHIVQGLVMECDQGQSVYLLKNPIVRGDVDSATPLQIGHKNLWYVEVRLKSDVAAQIDQQLSGMTGTQLAFSYGGAVLTDVIIDSSFKAAHFAITGNYDKTSATKLAQQLAG